MNTKSENVSIIVASRLLLIWYVYFYNISIYGYCGNRYMQNIIEILK